MQLTDEAANIPDIVVLSSGCWLWTRAKDREGYPLKRDGRSNKAHRMVYETFNGPIADGLTIDHLCRFTSCVNPAHLEAVTNKENILRGNGWGAKNARKTSCPLGHPYKLGIDGWRRCPTCRARQLHELRARRQHAH